MDRAALFVRIPMSQARCLDARARALGQTKQEMVSDLLASSLAAPPGAARPVPAASPRGPDGLAESDPDEILTLKELAAMLKLEVSAVMARVASRELPGRRFGDDWRFSRLAVLRWMDGTDAPDRAPGFQRPPPRPTPVR